MKAVNFKKIDLVEYNKDWPKIFQEQEKEIKHILSGNVKEVYHVGSTSVKGLKAKPVIDVICEVLDQIKTIEPLKKAGYDFKGEINLPFRLYFSRKIPHHVHLKVCKVSSVHVEQQLIFRNFLNQNFKEAKEYSDLKQKIIDGSNGNFKMVGDMFSEYTLRKANFISKILDKAGFVGKKLAIAIHDEEIKAFKKFLPDVEVTFPQSTECVYVLFLKGTEAVGAALLKSSCEEGDKIVQIKACNKENERDFLNRIHEWLDFRSKLLKNI
ncbi:MAG: GrpB family protein [Oscillospiraceae bacterium]|jgi:GrpB-like predicted nucleotidyltransferase (UPF0157 family)|nr:GrpB family protein [Oscillospiraceae bacterium]